MMIVQSKKFQSAVLAAIIIAVLVESGLSIEESAAIASPFVAYILGQGVADVGKEAAKIKNGN